MRKTIKVKKLTKIPNEAKKGKKAISDCLETFLGLVKKLEADFEKGDLRFTRDIKASIKSLLVAVDQFNGKKQSIKNVEDHKQKDNSEDSSEYTFTTKHNLNVKVKQSEIEIVLQLMEIFKIEEYKGSEHFLFVSEERHIKTSIDHDFSKRDVTPEAVAKLHDNWVPETFLFKTAANSMKWGEAEMEMESGIKIKSSQEISYILQPYSEFSNRLLEQDAIPINLGPTDQNPFKPNYKVDSLDRAGGKWNSLIDLMKSIFVHYYVIVGGFYYVLICDDCNCLFLRKQDTTSLPEVDDESPAITCSDGCYKLIWKRKNPLKAAKDKCFNNQREWIKENLYVDKIKESSPFCLNRRCPVDVNKRTAPRGNCPYLLEIYGAKVEDKYFDVTGRKYQANLCRLRQNHWYKNKLGQPIDTRIEYCDDCPLTLYPVPGGCPFLCEKHGEKLEE